MNRKALDSHIIDAVNMISNESGVSKEDVFHAIEESFITGAQKKYGHASLLIAKCDRNTGEINLYRRMKVVEEVENNSIEIDFKRAKKIKSDIKIGDEIQEEIPCNFDRNIIQKISGTIYSTIKSSKKQKEYDMYKDRVGDLVAGSIKSISPKEIIIWLSNHGVEAKMDSRQAMPNERFSIGEHISAVISEVRQDQHNPQIILSRRDEKFLIAVMRQEVPEIADELVTIVKVAREAGQRSKVVVSSIDSRLDPVGACVGGRGVRIQGVMKALGGEKIDIIEATSDVESLIYRAITPARPTQVIVDHVKKVAEVIVDDTNFSLAIGKRGQNVRLVAKLIDYTIDIMLESQRQEKAAKRFNDAAVKISNLLNLDEVVGQVLVASGFTRIENIAAARIEEIAKIEGFDADVAEVIIARSIECVNQMNATQDKEIATLGIEKSILDLPILTKDMIIHLAKNDIKKISDIADLASDELVEFFNGDLSEYEAGEIVMIARKFCKLI